MLFLGEKSWLIHNFKSEILERVVNMTVQLICWAFIIIIIENYVWLFIEIIILFCFILIFKTHILVTHIPEIWNYFAANQQELYFCSWFMECTFFFPLPCDFWNIQLMYWCINHSLSAGGKWLFLIIVDCAGVQLIP